jgi:hypothetical protein
VTASHAKRANSARTQPKRPVPVTLVAVVAVGVAIYSLVYGVLAVRTGEQGRLPDAIYHQVGDGGAVAPARVSRTVCLARRSPRTRGASTEQPGPICPFERGSDRAQVAKVLFRGVEGALRRVPTAAWTRQRHRLAA